MNQIAAHREALLQLLESTRLRPHEVSERLERALDRSYWQELNPSLSIADESDDENIETAAFEPRAQAKLKEAFVREGHFRIHSLLASVAVDRLKVGMEVVRGAGWPSVFGFVYDQFWLVSRAPSLVGLLSTILGPNYKQNCHVWSHYVFPKRGATGWPPHVDNPGRQNRITIWIALNDATLENGCMHVIPKDLAPPGMADNFVKLDAFSHADVSTLLQAGRALPAPAGTVLGWGPEIIHWGSGNTTGGRTHPRISISQEFVEASMTPREDELPLFDTAGCLPTFEQRLYAVATGILNYQKMETLLIRYADLAKKLVSATRTAVNAA
jgi:hypothetical protein